MKSIDSEALYRDGKHYDAKNKHYTGDISFYVNQAKKIGQPVLELACGTGRITIPIADQGWEITGIDISTGMLKKAAEKSKSHQSIQWLQEDIRKFDLNQKFKLIILPFNAIAHLHPLEDLETCLASVKKHLQKNGRFILDFFNPNFKFLIIDNKQPRLAAKYPDPYSDETVILTEINTYDAATQINHIKWHYKIGEKESTNELNMRIYYPQELDALLKYNGFNIEEKYGDFDESPFASSSLKQIIICKHS